MVTRFILIAVATEALVELWKTAAPLQGIKEKLISCSPFLYSKRQNTHLLNCSYCMSVWMAGVTIGLYFTCEWIVGIIAIHRISNYIHLAYSIIRDRQIDLRINRNKR